MDLPFLARGRTRGGPLGLGAALLAGLASVGPAACTDGVPARVEAYEAAIAQALGASSAPGFEAYRAQALALPPRRLRRLAVDAGERVGMFDFLALQGCRIGELAGFRNSPLGRVMRPAKRLVYELEAVAAGRSCLDGLTEERRRRLTSLLAAKEAELPRHGWNALWTSEEFEAWLSPAARPAALAPRDARPPLRRLRRLVEAGIESVEEAQGVEAALAALRRAPPLGPALRSFDRSRHGFEQIAAALEARTVNAPPARCQAVEVRLTRAFHQHYLRSVQPRLSELDRRTAPLLVDLIAIYRATRRGLELDPVLDAHAARHYDPENEKGSWSLYREAVRRHARAWEPLLSACNAFTAAR